MTGPKINSISDRAQSVYRIDIKIDRDRVKVPYNRQSAKFSFRKTPLTDKRQKQKMFGPHFRPSRLTKVRHRKFSLDRRIFVEKHYLPLSHPDLLKTLLLVCSENTSEDLLSCPN